MIFLIFLLYDVWNVDGIMCYILEWKIWNAELFDMYFFEGEWSAFRILYYIMLNYWNYLLVFCGWDWLFHDLKEN